VLIVDDEPSIRFLLRFAFEDAGHTVMEAQDGKRALATIAASRPDLVTTDFMMPVLNGAQLIARLREDPETAEIPILLVSSSVGASKVEGADDFMQKPLDPAEAVDRAEALLRRNA
jgi:DNA-binding response OmpR family regulator